LTRATGFGRVPGYFARAAEEIWTVIQIETGAALEALEEIASVTGVDALFVDPADLAASLGYGADQSHDDMRSEVLGALRRIRAAGKPAGLLAGDRVLQAKALAAEVDFLALGVDAGILARGAEALLKSVRDQAVGTD